MIVEQSAKFLNCSVKQVYAMLKQAGLAPQTKKGDRKVRTDKGFPDGVAPDELGSVAEMLLPQDESLTLRAVG